MTYTPNQFNSFLLSFQEDHDDEENEVEEEEREAVFAPRQGRKKMQVENCSWKMNLHSSSLSPAQVQWNAFGAGFFLTMPL